MSRGKHLLIGFVGCSEKDAERCSEIAERYLDRRGYGTFRVDVLRPLRVLQAMAHQVFVLPSPGDPDQPNRFQTDTGFQDHVLVLFEQELGRVLRSRVEMILALNESFRIAIITTDLRNRVDRTVEDLGYRVIRLESVKSIARGEHSDDNWVKHDCLVFYKDFRKSPRRSIEEAIAAVIRKRKNL